MFLPVDDDRCDLLVKEDEDGGEECGDDGQEHPMPRYSHRVDKPRSILSGCLKLAGYVEFGCV